ncbi:Chromatin structure-remodeling complex subunit rsc7 [Escovopsis weberi]|uniref:Chromatin structure-remodeling complex subunit rsc7 n=1 Tax=Escovopsis weberi TaxID=150374 RepID=A0A0M8MZN0_ESCWE|nr:Chromatin structure-remodeling complex subunit rsc7 [Escovopsis weberi]
MHASDEDTKRAEGTADNVEEGEGDGDGDGDVDAKAEESDDNGDDNDDDNENENGDGAAKDGDEEEGGDDLSEASAKEPTPPPQPVIRRKRLGRPPKNRPPDWDNTVAVSEREADTPRRRGRGGWRGRGGRKGGPAVPKAEQVIDADGTVADIVDDECVLPEDPEGETKVDKMGVLQGGRDYRCRTFTVLGRGNRLYMLSTEPARCVGFRDSYLFFTKHRKLYKIIVDDEEKRDMIEREIIPHSYKGRSIGIVTARSVFLEFGARIVVGGRRIVDDYAVAQARAEGVPEGQIADPDDRYNPAEPYNKNQYVAWHGASAVYHTNLPSAPVPMGKTEMKKRRVNVNDVNWITEHAREASAFNASINAIRKFNNQGVYDVHTNIVQYPAIMQPTLARIEQVGPGEGEGEGRGERGEGEGEEAAAAAKRSTVFPPVPARLARSFYIADTYLETPAAGGAPTAAYSCDPSDLLAPFRGLGAVSDEVKELLPAECREAFDKALRQEREWRMRWGTEKTHTSRRDPIIDKAIVPFNMTG